MIVNTVLHSFLCNSNLPGKETEILCEDEPLLREVFRAIQFLTQMLHVTAEQAV